MPANPPPTDPDFAAELGLARQAPIGLSFEGRPIDAHRFAAHRFAARDRDDELSQPLLQTLLQPLLVVGGVHGDEPSSVDAVVALGRRLVSGAAVSPAPVWLVPRLNPDGLARAQKNSARDVDLNRNFPAANFSVAHRPGYFPGTYPLSEPETAALAALIERERVGAVVAVHAPFACVNHDGPAGAWAARVATACGWPARADIGYPTPGSLGSWLGVDRKLPVLTLELPPGPFEAFRETCRVALDEALRVTL